MHPDNTEKVPMTDDPLNTSDDDLVPSAVGWDALDQDFPRMADLEAAYTTIDELEKEHP
jgi:hypothetical protein